MLRDGIKDAGSSFHTQCVLHSRLLTQPRHCVLRWQCLMVRRKNWGCWSLSPFIRKKIFPQWLAHLALYVTGENMTTGFSRESGKGSIWHFHPLSWALGYLKQGRNRRGREWVDANCICPKRAPLNHARAANCESGQTGCRQVDGDLIHHIMEPGFIFFEWEIMG